MSCAFRLWLWNLATAAAKVPLSSSNVVSPFICSPTSSRCPPSLCCYPRLTCHTWSRLDDDEGMARGEPGLHEHTGYHVCVSVRIENHICLLCWPRPKLSQRRELKHPIRSSGPLRQVPAFCADRAWQNSRTLNIFLPTRRNCKCCSTVCTSRPIPFSNPLPAGPRYFSK